MKRQLIQGAFLLAGTLISFSGDVCANVGPPSRGGHLIGEPIGVVDIAIISEVLTIDLRPLAQGNLANVQAIYVLHNAGSKKTLDLLFASGSAGMTDFRIWLGNQPIQGTAAKDAKLPRSWQAPTETPGFSSGDDLALLGYHPGELTPMAFSVTIPPGRHELKVQYSAQSARNRLGTPNVFHQFAYVLAPARAWSDFGGLDVTVHLPESWRAACNLTLARDGDSLKGRFADVPADALTLTVQASEGWVYWLLKYTSIALLCLAGVGGIVMCWKGGRSAARSVALSGDSDPNERLWSKSFGLGLIWGITVLSAGAFANLGPEQALPAGQVSNYGYGQMLMILGILLLSVLLVPVGFLIAHSSGTSPYQGGAK